MNATLNLRSGQVLEVDIDAAHSSLHRVCWIDVDRDELGLIEMSIEKPLPRIESLKGLLHAITENCARVTSTMPAMIPAGLRSLHTSDSASLQTTFASTLMPFFKEHERLLFDEDSRWRAIKRAAQTFGITEPTVLKYLRRYYQEGMTGLAFLPRYNHRGKSGPRFGNVKLGRPVTAKHENGLSQGMLLDALAAHNLQAGYQEFFVNGSNSVTDAYLLTLSKYFPNTVIKTAEGELKKRVDGKYPIPSLRQFRYHGEKLVPRQAVLLSRKSDRDVELDFKPVLHSVRNQNGPGAQYQVDATGGLVELVDDVDRSRRIGKATIYVVIDNYSQLIVGWYVGLENSSYSALIHVLESAFTDKEQELELYDSKLREMLRLEADQPIMPTGIVCDELLTDGGPEMVCEQTNRLIDFGLLRMGTAKPYAANWKSYVERYFRELKQKLRKVPGAANNSRKRSVKQPETLAILTLEELKAYVVHSIILYNYSHTLKTHPDLLLLKNAGFETATPIDFWKFGSATRSGLGRQYPRETLRALMLPRKEVAVTPYGLKVGRLFYTCETLLNQLAFHRGFNQKNQKVTVVFDRRNVSVIWLDDGNGGLGEPCYLTSRCERFAGKNLWEVERILDEEENFAGSAERIAKIHTIPIHEHLNDIVTDASKARKEAPGKTQFDADARHAAQDGARMAESWSEELQAQSNTFIETELTEETDYLDEGLAEAFL